MNNNKCTQKQPWHVIPYTKSQYLHELSNVPSWDHVIPLAMGSTSDNSRQKTVFATNLGLYSTTTGCSYCVSLSTKIDEYKVDCFDQSSPTDIDYRRLYAEQHYGRNDSVFTNYVYSNPNIYFPRDENEFMWTGFCFRNYKDFQRFFQPENKEYFDAIQFLDLRLCEEISNENVIRCLLYLPQLVTILLPTKYRKAQEETVIGRLFLQESMLDGTSPDSRIWRQELELTEFPTDFRDPSVIPEWIKLWKNHQGFKDEAPLIDKKRIQVKIANTKPIQNVTIPKMMTSTKFLT